MKLAESWREPRNETNSMSDVEDLLDLYCGWCEMLTRGSDESGRLEGLCRSLHAVVLAKTLVWWVTLLDVSDSRLASLYQT